MTTLMHYKKVHRLPEILVALCLILPMPYTSAATIQVTAQIGEPGCDLVEAINTANADVPLGGCIANNGSFGDDLIALNFDVPISEFIVHTVDNSNSFGANGLPQITSKIQITGFGNNPAVVIKRSSTSGTPNFRLFSIGSNYGDLTLRNISVQNGMADDAAGFDAGLGGAIHAPIGGLTVVDSEFINNQALGGGALALSDDLEPGVNITGTRFINNRSTSFRGGGAIWASRIDLNIEQSIFRDNQSNAKSGALSLFRNTAVVRRSLFVDNTAATDGGAINGNQAQVFIYESTISNNSACENGGGIGVQTSDENTSFTITNTTISGNQSGRGGGIHVNPQAENGIVSNLSVINALISGNQATQFSGGQEILIGLNGEADVTLTNSLLGHVGLFATSNAVFGDYTSVDTIFATSDGDTPTALADILQPLADNGGASQTHALSPNSPAIDAASDGFIVQFFFTLFVPGCRGTEISPPTPLPVFRPDQRGIERPINGKCDMGAYELKKGDTCYSIKASNDNVVVFCL